MVGVCQLVWPRYAAVFMLAMYWLAEVQVMAPSCATHSDGAVGLVHGGRPKVLVAARLALASQVTLVTGS